MKTRPYPFAQTLFEAYTRKLKYKFTGVISLSSKRISKINTKGTVLLSYITNPFLLSPHQRLSPSHTAPWECAKIARIFLDRGYDVDVIEWTNSTFIPRKKYDFLIDIHKNIERLSPILNPECKKILHIVASYWKFQNDAEQARLTDLEQRTGKKLIPRRTLTPSQSIEKADYVEGLGNEFTFGTYASFNKMIFPIPISATVLYDSPDTKDFEAVRKNFLWIGGGGMVHKGLDRVLEVFKEHPEFNLTICGPVSAEKDFEDAYRQELYSTPNITVMGKTDISSQAFKDIIKNCVALIYPSCSEGQSGAVVEALHAGLIPIISYESGVSVDGFGIILKESSKSEIIQSLQKISSLDATTLKIMAHKAWQYARIHHTKETFSTMYSLFVDTILLK